MMATSCAECDGTITLFRGLCSNLPFRTFLKIPTLTHMDSTIRHNNGKLYLTSVEGNANNSSFELFTDKTVLHYGWFKADCN